tara:strand:+ start:345 stop:716 length:372 start_codon:yes stop_codon:yes gene_type:complete
MKKKFLFKIIFHISNFFLCLLYLYPGSILGWLIYDNYLKQPQIMSNFLISTNHACAFILLSTLGLFSYHPNKHKIVFFYLFSLSIFLELCHIIIPNRSFEFDDLLGNLAGVFFIFILRRFMKL